MTEDKRKIEDEDDRRQHRRVKADFEINGRWLEASEVDDMLKSLTETKMVTVSVSTGKWARLATVNISTGGMCVVGSLKELGDKMPREDERVFLDIEIPDGEPPLKAMARVAWVVNAGADGGKLGLEFIKIETGGAARLKKHVEPSDG